MAGLESLSVKIIKVKKNVRNLQVKGGWRDNLDVTHDSEFNPFAMKDGTSTGGKTWMGSEDRTGAKNQC